MVDLLETEGFKVSKKDIQLEEPIKMLGVYTVPIKIEKDIIAQVKLWVIRKA